MNNKSAYPVERGKEIKDIIKWQEEKISSLTNKLDDAVNALEFIKLFCSDEHLLSYVNTKIIRLTDDN